MRFAYTRLITDDLHGLAASYERVLRAHRPARLNGASADEADPARAEDDR